MNDDLKILLKDNLENNQMDSPISNEEATPHIVRPVNNIHDRSRKAPKEDFETAQLSSTYRDNEQHPTNFGNAKDRAA